MNTAELRVLIVDDSRDDAELIARALRRAGYALDCIRVDRMDTLMTALGEPPWDVVICDSILPFLDGERALAIVRARLPTARILLVSGRREVEIGPLVRRGVDGFVSKDRLSDVAPMIGAMLPRAALSRRLAP